MSADLECPQCKAMTTQVIDTRNGAVLGMSIRRRRRCFGCGFRFTTHERHLRENTETSAVKLAIAMLSQTLNEPKPKPKRTGQCVECRAPICRRSERCRPCRDAYAAKRRAKAAA